MVNILIVVTSLQLLCSFYYCRCVPEKSVSSAYKNADLIFTGKATFISDEKILFLRSTKFKINTVIKGHISDSLKIYSTGGNCSYLFKKDSNYIVYGRYLTARKAYTVSICSKTAILNNKTHVELDSLKLLKKLH